MTNDDSDWEVIIPFKIRELMRSDPRFQELETALEILIKAGPGVEVGEWDPRTETYKFSLWSGSEIYVIEYVETDDERLNWIEVIDVSLYP